jgi:hypothetical protein
MFPEDGCVQTVFREWRVEAGCEFFIIFGRDVKLEED